MQLKRQSRSKKAKAGAGQEVVKCNENTHGDRETNELVWLKRVCDCLVEWTA